MKEKKHYSLLEEGIDKLDFTVSSSQRKSINRYLQELLKWNQVYNLTGFQSQRENIIKNVLDCLVVAPYIKAQNLLDVGTGAGLPGVLLSIVNEQSSWVLLDANGKKTRFLHHIKQSLNLGNIQIENNRVESYHPNQGFEGVCSRAFDKIPDTLRRCEHLLEKDGCFYALKGAIQTEDLENLPEWVELLDPKELFVPMLDQKRHLICCIKRN